MIEEMRYVTITGPIDHIDWVIERYLGRYEIHLEYAIQQIKDVSSLRTFTIGGENPYQESADWAAFFLELLKDMPSVYFPMTGKKARAVIEEAANKYEERSNHFKELERQRDVIASYISSLRPFSALDAELQKLDRLKHFNCVFGYMPIKNFLQIQTFLYEDLPLIFVEAFRDTENVWGCFFSLADEDIDALLAPYNLKHLAISSKCLDIEAPGSVLEISTYWEERLKQIRAGIQEMAGQDLPQKNILLAACHTVQRLNSIVAVKQYAAKTAEHYIFIGWLAKSDALSLEYEAKGDKNTIVIHYEAEPDKLPPTKLVNPPGVRWFEFFVRLYGIPKYSEMDPTSILAAAYVLLFGMMFGDVGHGLGVALLGWFLQTKDKTKDKDKPKHMRQLGGIMIAAGIAAAGFGFLYGSIFGIENLLPALWRHPIQDIAGTLQFAVALGAVIILLTFVLNIVNGIRQNDFDRIFFSPNGVAGLLLYVIAIAYIVGLPVPVWTAGLPLLAIIYKGMAHQAQAGIGMTIFQRALGLFEIMLAYLTNTISFVRVGAFALSHAGMMHVVMMLSQGAADSRNLVLFILGNGIVMAIEGLLIGIQSLRLGFYEIFSRFFEGGGRSFESSVQKNEMDFSG